MARIKNIGPTGPVFGDERGSAEDKIDALRAEVRKLQHELDQEVTALKLRIDRLIDFNELEEPEGE